MLSDLYIKLEGYSEVGKALVLNSPLVLVAVKVSELGKVG